MASMAADAVRLQNKLDEHNELTAIQYHQVTARVDESMQWMLPPPRQMLVNGFEVSARLEWAQHASTSASVQVIVPNLSADIRYDRETGNDSRFHIHVQRVPPHEPPPKKPPSSQI